MNHSPGPDQTRESIELRIARYRQYAEDCRVATGNSDLELSERCGAQLGEMDWLVALEMAQEELEAFDRDEKKASQRVEDTDAD